MRTNQTVTVKEESIFKVLELMLEANPRISAGVHMDKLASECGYDGYLHMIGIWEDYYRDRGEEMVA